MDEKPTIDEALKGLRVALTNGTDPAPWVNVLNGCSLSPWIVRLLESGERGSKAQFEQGAEGIILLYLAGQRDQSPYGYFMRLVNEFWNVTGPDGITEYGATWYVVLAIFWVLSPEQQNKIEAYVAATAALSKRAHSTNPEIYLTLDLVFADLESWRANPNREQVRRHMRKAAEGGLPGGALVREIARQRLKGLADLERLERRDIPLEP